MSAGRLLCAHCLRRLTSLDWEHIDPYYRIQRPWQDVHPQRYGEEIVYVCVDCLADWATKERDDRLGRLERRESRQTAGGSATYDQATETRYAGTARPPAGSPARRRIQ